MKDAALRLLEWTYDPSKPHGLDRDPDPHNWRVLMRVPKAEFRRVARTLTEAKWSGFGGNTHLTVLLLEPEHLDTLADDVRRLLPDVNVEFGEVYQRDDDERDE